MKILSQIYLLFLAMSTFSFAMEHSSGTVLNLLNSTGSTLNMELTAKDKNVSGYYDIEKKEIGKGQNVKLALNKYSKIVLSFRTQQYRTYKDLVLPLNDIKRLANGNDATLEITTSGYLNPELTVDLNKLVVLNKAEEHNKLKKIIIQNSAMDDLTVEYTIKKVNDLFLKGVKQDFPDVDYKNSTEIKPNDQYEISPVYEERTEKSPEPATHPFTQTFKKILLNVIIKPAPHSQLTGHIELPLERIKREAQAQNASTAIVPITRKSHLTTKEIIFNVNSIEYSNSK